MKLPRRLVPTDYTNLIDCIADGFFALDAGHNIVHVNPAGERLAGMCRSDILGKNYWEVFPDTPHSFQYHQFSHACKQRASTEFEQFHGPSGRWLRVKVAPTPTDGMTVLMEDISSRKGADDSQSALLERERKARAEAEALSSISRALTGELDLEKVVQSVTDAATRLTGAQFGAFFYNVANEKGESYLLYTLSGAPREAFASFGLPRNTPVFERTFRGLGVVRSDDILQDPHYGTMAPHHGMPPGHLPVRSYLAVPVIGRTGEVLGGLFFGHPQTCVFGESAERIAVAIAAQAAVAIDNSQLFTRVEREIERRRRTEDQLRDREQRFRQMIDALPAAIYTTDPEGRVTHFNPAAVELAGRVPRLGEDKWCVMWKLFTADGTPLPHDQCPMAVAVREGQPGRGLECIAERPDGSRVWFAAYPTPLRDDSGRISGGINMLLDITSRKDTEQALRQSEERFRAMVETSPECVKIIAPDGTLLQMNSAGLAMVGANSPSDVVGHSVYDLIAPEHREQYRAFNQRICAGEKGMLEFDIVAPNGQRRSMETHAVPFPGPEDQVVHLAVTRDVTGRKQREHATWLLGAIVDSSDDAIISKDLNGVITSWNKSAERVFGYTADEAIGKSITMIIPRDRLDEEPQILSCIRRGERIEHFETIRRRKDGVLRNISLTISPIKDSTGRIIGASKIARDTTESRRAERVALHFSALVDSSDDAIISKDLNGLIKSWNQSAERLFGYTAEEAIGQPITILVPPDRLEEEAEILKRIRQGERVDHFETIRRRKDGTLLDVSLTISPIKDAQGRIVGASKIARDVSDRKRIESAVQNLNAQLTADLSAVTHMQRLSTRLVQADDFPQLLSEIVDAGIEITGAEMGSIQLLENGRLTTVSHRGFEPGLVEFLNQHPDGEAAGASALREGQRVIIDDVASDPRYSDGAREALLGAGAVAVQSTPLISRYGQVLGIFSTHYRVHRRPTEREFRLLDVLGRQAADLIERKRAEAALLESEGRFRHLADAMPQIVWTARPDGEVDYFNERWYEFTGFPRNWLGNDAWQAILHPDDRERALESWSESIASGRPYETECRFWDQRVNRWRWFMSRALRVRDSEGKIVKWFGTSTDIDEQKRVEDELRRANQDLEQFAYSASHDLQEPLRSIKIYGELLSSRYAAKLDGQALEFIEYLRTGASRMEMLVRDLLAYTQVIGAGIPEEDVDANEALAGAIEALGGAIKETGATVSSDPLPDIRVHRTHLVQVFQNLIGNALKYRDLARETVVKITARREKNDWVFSVCDNGIGIEPEYKEHIFGLFKRLHTGDEYSGTGIGLAICQRIVERYHGRIWVESEPGRGSCFQFSIPI